MNGTLGEARVSTTWHAYSLDVPDWLPAAIIAGGAIAILTVGAVLFIVARRKARRRPPPLPPR